MKDFGIRVLTIEGALETSEFETRAGRRFFDITDVVAKFVAERTTYRTPPLCRYVIFNSPAGTCTS